MTILAIIAGVLALVGVGKAALARTSVQISGAPPVANYQGRVLVQATPYTGMGYFKFALVNAAGNQTYWSNDGSAAGGSEPTHAVTLSVSGGLFQVLLGDTSVSGMSQALSAEVFTEPDRYLRVWFSADGSAFTQLSPDRRVAASPYALQAATAQEADLLDGRHGNEFADASHTHPGSDITSAVATATLALQAQNALSASYTLNADMLDGQHASELAGASHTHLGDDITSAVATATLALQAQEVLSASQALDTDMLDGLHGSDYAGANHTHLGSDVTTAVATATLALQAPEAFTATYALDADTLDGLDGNAYQRYLNTLCPPGQLAQGITGDAVVCKSNESFIASLIPTTTHIITPPLTGGYINVTVGGDGLPLISYQSTDRDFVVVHCEDLLCTAQTVTTLDTAGWVGAFSSGIVRMDGLPLFSYFDSDNGSLKVADCQNVTCTTAITRTVDTSGAASVGWFSVATLGVDGLPFISYYDNSNGNLKVAHCQDAGCVAATITTLDATGDVGEFTAIALGVDGLPIIGYRDDTQNALKVAHCENLDCTVATFTRVDAGDVSGTSMVIGKDGLPTISYYDITHQLVKIAHCQDVACSASDVTVLDNVAAAAGWYVSSMLNANGLVLTTYYSPTTSALIASHCQNVTCTAAIPVQVDHISANLLYPAVTLGSDGLPLIAYFDAVGELRIAHCSNAFCTPYFRRR